MCIRDSGCILQKLDWYVLSYFTFSRFLQDLKAAIKSAGSAAAKKTEIQRPIQRSQQTTARNPDGAAGWAPPLDYDLPGGCTSSRLHYVFHIPTRSHGRHPLSGPFSIDIIYPRKWQIAIPLSLMRVDEHILLFFATFVVVFFLPVRGGL